MANREKENPRLSIITINYKTDDLILDLLKSLTPDPKIEIIIIDNSPENTLEKKLPIRNDLTYFFVNKNLGFSGGNNLGISKAKGEWVFLLNSDTKVNTSEILKMFDITVNNPVLVSTAKLIQPNGDTQNSVGFFDPVWINPANYVFGRPRLLICEDINEDTLVDYATGTNLMIHRSVFDKVGFLDDKNFFMYFEDVDFCFRLHREGIKILFIPEIKILHYGGASSDQNMRQKNVNYQNGLRSYLIKNRGRLIYFINSLFHFLR